MRVSFHCGNKSQNPESVTQYFLAGGETNRRLKDGTVENERYTSPFSPHPSTPAGNHERTIVEDTPEGRIEDTRIYTNQTIA